MKTKAKAFSMVEILIWIFIFTLWLTGIYLLIVSTLGLNDYSKNSIIASNLAREWLELVRNTRDTNYNNLYNWNKLPGNNVNAKFSTGAFYTVENDFRETTSQSVLFQEIPDFAEWKSVLTSKMEAYRLCLDAENKYTHFCPTGSKKTYFYRYLKFDPVVYNSGSSVYVENDALKVKSKVIWYNRGYHEIELDTILTDWQRQ